MKHRALPALAAIAAFGLAPLAAHAQTAFVDVYDPTADNEAFGTINLKTGVFTQISSGGDSLFALGFGSDGSLYGLAPDSDNGTDDDLTDLFQISPQTGAQTYVTTYSIGVEGGSTNSAGVFNVISPADASDTSTLFTIDPVTEQFTQGQNTTAVSDGLLVDDGKGHLLTTDFTINASGTDELTSITPTTGAVTNVGNTTVYDAFTGVFSGSSLYTFAESKSGVESIYTLNTTTGKATKVTGTNISADLVNAAALAPAAAPEPSSVAALSIGILGLSALALRARRRTAA